MYQIKRAADSVVLNIAEGTTIQSEAGLKKFLVISNCFALEAVACLYHNIQRKNINKIIFDDKYQKYEKLIAMIQALIKTLDFSGNSKR